MDYAGTRAASIPDSMLYERVYSIVSRQLDHTISFLFETNSKVLLYALRHLLLIIIYRCIKFVKLSLHIRISQPQHQGAKIRARLRVLDTEVDVESGRVSRISDMR